MSCNDIKQILASENRSNQMCFSSATRVEEQGSVFEIDNPTNLDICCIKIDGCLIKGDSSKCDYLFVHSPPTKYKFVELKSKSEISHAYTQIVSSINQLSDKLKLQNGIIEAFVVTKLTPVGANQITRNFKAQFRRDYRGNLQFSGNGNMKIVI